jgi:hypothetical protein
MGLKYSGAQTSMLQKSISWDIVDTARIILDLSLSFYETWEEAGRSRALRGLTFLSSKLATLPRWILEMNLPFPTNNTMNLFFT